MAQLQRPSQKSNDAIQRERTDVSVQESPMTGNLMDDAMSPEALGNQEDPTLSYDSSMTLPFQADQLGMAGDAQDVGPFSAVYTRRQVYVTPGGDVTEQVTEYTTTTRQAGTGNEQAFDPYYNATAAGAPGYDQMNPSAGFGDQGFFETITGLGGDGGQFLAVPGFAVNNPAISTDLTTTPTPYSDVTIGEGRPHPHARNAPPVDTRSTEPTTTE